MQTMLAQLYHGEKTTRHFIETVNELGHIHWMVNQRNIRNEDAKGWFSKTS